MKFPESFKASRKLAIEDFQKYYNNMNFYIRYKRFKS